MIGHITIDTERCKGCTLCISYCPKKSIHLSDELNLKGYFVAAFDEHGECTVCGNCALMCPDVAIVVSVATGAAGTAGATDSVGAAKV